VSNLELLAFSAKLADKTYMLVSEQRMSIEQCSCVLSRCVSNVKMQRLARLWLF